MAINASFFDKRRYPTTSAAEGYGEWAATYEETMAVGLDRPLLPRLTSIDWRAVAQAADLACGTGRTGEWLKAKGVAAIDGVDLTHEMLAIAKTKDVHRRLLVGDLTATPLSSESYDLVVMSLADEHLRDLRPAYTEAARLASRGGKFLLLGYHPFFLMNGLPTHFHRADGEAITIESFVHFFSDHFAAGSAAGLRLAEFLECVIDEEWLKSKPKWRQYVNWPASFALVWKKD
jgi:SAM-dependent methyltransferase